MTRIWFIARRPDIVKAFGDRIYFTAADAEAAKDRHCRLYPEHPELRDEVKVYSALVEVEQTGVPVRED